MTAPWEKYAAPEPQGPWSKFAPKVDREAIAKQIDNDPISQGAKNFTSEMSAGMQSAAGVGKALTDIGQAAKQMVGFGPSASDVQERRRIDAPLMSTASGAIGNIAGNIAAFAPTALVPGANTVAGAGAMGALTGALQPTTGAGERIGNMSVGGALGSGVQTVARYPLETMEVAKKYAGAPFRAAKAMVEPFYQGGREQILGRALRDATGPASQAVQQRLANSAPLVPGSLPTAAEVGESGGLAALQRGAAASNPEAYATRATQQNEARVAALQDLAGTAGKREFFAADRAAVTGPMYDTAYQLGVDLSKMSPARRGEITKLMNTPAIQQAMSEAKNLAANEMVNMKNPAGSVKGLDYVKRALDDQISNSTGNEQRVLVGLKNRLLTTLDTLSPDYGMARQMYQQMSRPINQMDVAQQIADKSIRPLDSTLQPAAFARALSDDTAASVTGMRNATLEGVMEPGQLSILNALKQDLARSVSARDLGRGPGSDTVQKLAMSNIMERAGIPSQVGNLPGVSRVGNWVYSSSDEQMRQMLADSLLNPQETARLMSRVPAYAPPMQTDPALGNRAAQLARMLALPAVPTAVEARQ